MWTSRGRMGEPDYDPEITFDLGGLHDVTTMRVGQEASVNTEGSQITIAENLKLAGTDFSIDEGATFSVAGSEGARSEP